MDSQANHCSCTLRDRGNIFWESAWQLSLFHLWYRSSLQLLNWKTIILVILFYSFRIHSYPFAPIACFGYILFLEYSNMLLAYFRTFCCLYWWRTNGPTVHWITAIPCPHVISTPYLLMCLATRTSSHGLSAPSAPHMVLGLPTSSHGLRAPYLLTWS